MGLALSLPALARGAPLPSATDEPWIEASTARFRVYSNGGEAAATRTARHLERLAEALERTTRGLQMDGGREVRAYAFRDGGSYAPYNPFPGDEISTTPGYHVTGDDIEHIVFQSGARETPFRIASHEYTHVVLSRNFGGLPLWVNEGLAEFYSTFQARKSGADIGYPIPEHIAWLRKHMFSIGHLFLFGGNSPDYRSGERRSTLYAQSWALVHTLVMDPAVAGRFGLLLTELARGTASIDALRSTYGPNAPDSLQARLRDVVSLSGMPYTHWQFAADFDAIPVRIRSLDRIETLLVLGELLAQVGEKLVPSARAHLEAAWNEDSARTMTAALRGALAEREGDRASASAWFERVGRSPSGDPRALAVAGTALAQRGLNSKTGLRWPAPGADSVARTARALLDRALAERPDEPNWLAQYGFTFLDESGPVHEGIGALIRAQETWPRRADIAGALSVLNLRAGNRGAALALYKRIPWAPDRARWRWIAGDLLAQSARVEISDFLREGRHAEAESLATSLRREVTGTGMAARFENMLGWIRDSAQRAKGR